MCREPRHGPASALFPPHPPCPGQMDSPPHPGQMDKASGGRHGALMASVLAALLWRHAPPSLWAWDRRLLLKSAPPRECLSPLSWNASQDSGPAPGSHRGGVRRCPREAPGGCRVDTAVAAGPERGPIKYYEWKVGVRLCRDYYPSGLWLHYCPHLHSRPVLGAPHIQPARTPHTMTSLHRPVSQLRNGDSQKPSETARVMKQMARHSVNASLSKGCKKQGVNPMVGFAGICRVRISGGGKVAYMVRSVMGSGSSRSD